MATTVTVSYPADVSDWERDQLTTDHMRAYLKRSNDHAREGDTWDVFVDVGCCGTSPDIPLRVEHVAGDASLDETAELAFVEREAAGVDAGWDVQSEASPEN
ncbi:hypothetical protein LPA44_02425 [Halobacterium sp. KA-4]|jgi:hypothetical protein|uniref:hypothetical protein n=1 Tax=Halobacterium sp. KA-4 TaxID=2896367 RepID=UPI001E5777A3|nr:hypothetical protein [Halobacterium sp. KA-4]MCD2198756.1 hypothetical protein [Halobacterium sp. KA-4]